MTTLRRYFLILTLLGSSCFASASVVPAESKIPEILNLDSIASRLKLSRFEHRRFDRPIKIAILDDGFAEWQKQVGVTLPTNTKHPIAPVTIADQNSTSFHGTLMANLVAELIKKSGAEADYELSLYDSFGYTKFKWAVEQVIANHVDVVLYAQVWDNGGNGDGQGFINALVDEALKQDVIWINAAGNFGQLTRLSPIYNGDDFMTFSDGKDHVSFECKAPANQTCNLDLTLAWNDFKNDPLTGTNKDLDLFLYQGQKLIDSSEKVQVLSTEDTNPKDSHLPREEIVRQVPAGIYEAKVRARSQNFDGAHDRLRLTASGLGIKMLDPDVDETLLPPADNPGVVVIGASDDYNSSQSRARGLPKIFFNSLLKLRNSAPAFESSNASAMAAAVTVLNLGLGTPKTKAAVEAKLIKMSDDPAPQKNKLKTVTEARADHTVLPRRATPFRSPSSPVEESYALPLPESDCFPRAALSYRSGPVDLLLSEGRGSGTFVEGRFAIVVPYDFWAYLGFEQEHPSQRLVLGPNGVRIVETAALPLLPRGTYEIISSTSPMCD